MSVESALEVMEGIVFIFLPLWTDMAYFPKEDTSSWTNSLAHIFVWLWLSKKALLCF